MRRVGRFVGLAALLGLVAVVSPLTSATGAKGGQTLRFSSRNSDNQFYAVDVDDSGDENPGDYFVGNFVLRHGGKTRGHLEFQCAVATASPARRLCHGVAHVDGQGEFVVEDVAPANAESERVTITGGTGTFGDASGNGKFVFGRNRIQLTFKLK
jgi:hypothetical protein